MSIIQPNSVKTLKDIYVQTPLHTMPSQQLKTQEINNDKSI